MHIDVLGSAHRRHLFINLRLELLHALVKRRDFRVVRGPQTVVLGGARDRNTYIVLVLPITKIDQLVGCLCLLDRCRVRTLDLPKRPVVDRLRHGMRVLREASVDLATEHLKGPWHGQERRDNEDRRDAANDQLIDLRSLAIRCLAVRIGGKERLVQQCDQHAETHAQNNGGEPVKDELPEVVPQKAHND